MPEALILNYQTAELITNMGNRYSESVFSAPFIVICIFADSCEEKGIFYTYSHEEMAI
jgi:hypothetical protein